MGVPLPFDNTRVRHDEYQRHEDIQHWVDTHRPRKWVALDDLPMYQLRESYVGTCGETGLTDANVSQAISILNS